MGMFCARNKILQSTVWKINRRLTRQKSQTPPDDVSSLSSSRPNVVPNQVFDTNINYLYQLEKSFRTSFRKSTGFPTDEITDGNRFKLEKRMLFYLDYLTKAGFRNILVPGLWTSTVVNRKKSSSNFSNKNPIEENSH